MLCDPHGTHGIAIGANVWHPIHSATKRVAESGTMTKRLLILATLVLGACGDDDGNSMNDAGPSPDSSVSVDATPAPDTGTTSGSSIYRELELADFALFCECAVEDGDFANQDACFDANPDGVSSDTQLTCVQGVLDGASEADLAIFACQNDVTRVALACLGTLSCADRTASPPTAAQIECEDTENTDYEACGTPTFEETLNDCFN